MVRNIYVGDAYSRKVVTPLITTDCNSYKIIWDSKCKNGVFKITAIKSDGTASFDFGILSQEGLAEYVIANNMYNTEGPLKLFLAIVENESVTTCREVNFTVKQGADEAGFAANNVNTINSLSMQLAGNKVANNEKFLNLQKYGVFDVYILKDGEDIKITDGVVTELLKSDFSMYEAVAFPEGITEIDLAVENSYHGQPFTANKVIMPSSLKTITLDSFSNDVIFSGSGRFDPNSETIKTQGEYTWEDTSVVVRVKEFVFNEGLEIDTFANFMGNIYLEKINIPSNWTKIETGAFFGCINLKGLVIPATVKEVTIDIPDTLFGLGAFVGYSDTIYGYGGTAAEIFANGSGLAFVNMGSDYSKQIEEKVDKVEGKGLSTEDYTTEEKEKLAGLEKSIEDAVANLVDSAPETLNTLDELAKALNNDENFASTVTNELAQKADKSQLSEYATKDDLGDIQTALDSIIAIQNELIGGESV